jgi:hypothetical protein
MTSEDVQAIAARELTAWRVPTAVPGSTYGDPWTAERYAPQIERLLAALVAPYRQRFELAEHADPRRRGHAGGYWVAVTEEIYLWYDEAKGDFGVGERTSDGTLPRSIGLRGDLVGSFCGW